VYFVILILSVTVTKCTKTAVPTAFQEVCICQQDC